MSNKVWIVEQGEYSDYSVVGIFSSEKKANRLMNLINERKSYSKAYVEERVLDPFDDELNEGLKMYYVSMLKNGDMKNIPEQEYIFPSSYFTCGMGVKCFDDNSIRGYVWAKDAKHAVKIVNEIRVHKIAEGW